MIELELEKTYLVKTLPKNLESFPHKDILDLYVTHKSTHPTLRIRNRGGSLEITKKQPILDGDASEQEEHTIRLNEDEFECLIKTEGKKVHKVRYDYVYDGIKAEIDVFKDELKGLILVDFEFKNEKEKDLFKIPDFCLVDVTQDETFAGGMLCGKKYRDIEKHLVDLGYTNKFL